MKERFLVIASSFLSTLCMVIGGIIITRTYSKTMLGTYQQVVLLYSMLSVFISLGTPKAILYFVGPNSNARKILVHILLLMSISFVIFAFILGFSWGRLCVLFSNPDLQSLFLLFAGNLLVRTINEIFMAVAITADKNHYIWRVEIVRSILLIVLTFIICYLRMSIDMLLIANLACELMKMIPLLKLIFFDHPGKWEGIDFALFREIIQYLLPLLISMLAILLSRKVDGFLVSSFMTPENFAVYSRGALDIPFGRMIINNIAILVMPIIVQFYKTNQLQEISDLYHKEVKRAASIIIPMFFSFLLVHKDFIVFFYTDKYIDSVPVFLFYLFILPIELFSLDTILQAMNHGIQVFYVSIIAAIVNISASVLLLPSLGIVAPALGIVLAFMVNNLLYLYFINRILKKGFLEWMPWKYLIETFFACLCVFCGFVILAQELPRLPLFLKISLLFGFSYLGQIAVLWTFHLLIPQDKALMIETFRKVFAKKNLS